MFAEHALIPSFADLLVVGSLPTYKAASLSRLSDCCRACCLGHAHGYPGAQCPQLICQHLSRTLLAFSFPGHSTGWPPSYSLRYLCISYASTILYLHPWVCYHSPVLSEQASCVGHCKPQPHTEATLKMASPHVHMDNNIVDLRFVVKCILTGPG